MNTVSRTLAVAWKEIQLLAKDRGTLAVLFLLPLLFTSLYGSINYQLNRPDVGIVSLDLGLVNEDDGVFGEEVAKVVKGMDELNAVLEDDNQNGFAHFCEHMAFNGTKSFPKNELVSFRESTGIRFGADLNAYTNQDETVYLLTLPSDDDEILENGVKVIRDWAGYVTYASEDIEAERGVVVEEWRTRQGAESRVGKIHAEAMYFGSKYAKRDVIGDTAVLLHSDAENARRFYKTWYGPQNMAIIAVGDIDVEEFEELLKDEFVLPEGLEGRTKKRPTILLPNHKDTKISIASDPELQVPHV